MNTIDLSNWEFKWSKDNIGKILVQKKKKNNKKDKRLLDVLQELWDKLNKGKLEINRNDIRLMEKLARQQRDNLVDKVIPEYKKRGEEFLEYQMKAEATSILLGKFLDKLSTTLNRR